MKKCLQEKKLSEPTVEDGWVPVQHQVWVRRIKGGNPHQLEYRVVFNGGIVVGGSIPTKK